MEYNIGELKSNKIAVLKEELLFDIGRSSLYTIEQLEDLVEGFRYSSEGALALDGCTFFCSMGKSLKGRAEKYLDQAAARLAEIWLSQQGLGLIPGIYPTFKRLFVTISAKARIAKAG